MTTEPKWTKGPWTRDGLAIFADETCIAQVQWILSAPGLRSGRRVEVEANANLMEAAPELYDELSALAERFVTLLLSCNVPAENVQKEIEPARAILAKARGEK